MQASRRTASSLAAPWRSPAWSPTGALACLWNGITGLAAITSARRISCQLPRQAGDDSTPGTGQGERQAFEAWEAQAQRESRGAPLEKDASERLSVGALARLTWSTALCWGLPPTSVLSHPFHCCRLLPSTPVLFHPLLFLSHLPPPKLPPPHLTFSCPPPPLSLSPPSPPSPPLLLHVNPICLLLLLLPLPSLPLQLCFP